MDKNIVLVGLPGGGKSTLGARVAERLGLAFLDMDAEIERRAGKSISEIFASDGEETFRELEAGLARESFARTRTVVATGGGVVLRPDNIRALRHNGFVVFLDRPPERIVRDVDPAGRPLLSGGAERIFALSEQRRPLYLDAADCVLPVGDRMEEALERLCMLIRGVVPPDGGFAVIGDPIGHTSSPRIHRTVFEALGLPDDYVPIHVLRGAVGAFAARARVSGLKGFNVTLPHKQDVLPVLDEIEPEAALCGAVNTVVVRDGKLHGYNTDMGGLLEALRANGHAYEGRRVVILGSGGAARGVALKAAREKAERIVVLDRYREDALALSDHIRDVAPGVPCAADGMTTETTARAAAEADLLINATPLGMAGVDADFSSLSFLEAIPPGALVCDLVYNPPETALLREAKRLGLSVMNGLSMLIFQALLADELFLGQKLDKPRLFQAVLEREQRKEKFS